MEYKKLTHAIILEYLRRHLSREYNSIKINSEGGQKADYKGHYPDMILGNHGMVLSILQVETEDTVNEEASKKWKELSNLGVKLIVMVPKDRKVKATDLIWSKGMAGKVTVGTYEISIKMS